MKVENLMLQYLDKKKLLIKQRTLDSYQYVCEHFVPKELKFEDTKKIKLDNLQKYLNDLAKKGLATNTIKLTWRVMKNILAQETKLKIPLENVVVPKTTEKQVNAFSNQEKLNLEQAIDVTKKPQEIGVLLALYLGLRLGEVLALRWEDIDFENSVVEIKRSVYKQKELYIFTTPKTKSSLRRIPLPQELKRILKKLKSKSNSAFIVNYKGNVVSPRNYQKRFACLQKRAGIKNLKGFHALRHTFASNALECGMDVRSLADIMGHKNASITLNRYAHSMFDYKEKMMNYIFHHSTKNSKKL